MEKRVPKGRKMWTVQIDENGGVHIPKEALALIGLKAGESAVLTGDKRRCLWPKAARNRCRKLF